MDFESFSKYFDTEHTGDGIKIVKSCPPEVRKSLAKMNDEYLRIMGDVLFIFD